MWLICSEGTPRNDSKDQRTVANYFNKDAMVIPSGPSPFGHVGRNTVRSDDFAQLDFAASKKIVLAHEGRTFLQFRAEAFNLLNKTNFLARSEEHTSELQSLTNLVCRLLL